MPIKTKNGKRDSNGKRTLGFPAGLYPAVGRLRRDFAQVQGSGVITPEIAAEALERLEVDYLGLDRIDRRILSTIIQNYAGGPVGLDTLAAAVGEESVTLEDVYEPYLMQIGFLTRTPRGRCVTRLAYNHLHLEAPDGVPDAQMTLQC